MKDLVIVLEIVGRRIAGLLFAEAIVGQSRFHIALLLWPSISM